MIGVDNFTMKSLIADKAIDDDVEPEGKIYQKIRDHPGQKCSYILPGDPYKETYRLSSFKKFSTEVPVDVCALAKHGFTYTGYKDRVKCFSCGSTVQNWEIFDDPKDAKWHFDQCKLVLGTETKNIPIIKNTINFSRNFASSLRSVTSDNSSTSFPPSTEVKTTQHFVSCSDTIAATSGVNAVLPQSMQIETSDQKTVHTERAVVPQVTAKVVQPNPTGPPKVEGLEFATIVSPSHKELLTKTLDLLREEDRRKSFVDWLYTFATVTPQALSEAGFFYLGNLDRVQCFSCSGVLRNWKEGDDVNEEHKKHFPICKMVMGAEIRNIPLAESIRKTRARKSFTLVEPADPSPQELENLKRQFPCLCPVNPHMRNFEDRLQTFDHRWPKLKINPTPRHIAKAGFFFLGDRDRAKCWYCNGGLQNWEPNDDPVTQHAKWFPGCEYILQCKGVDFVRRIVSETPNLNRPALRHPRFDHRTGKILTVSVQQQQQLIDPRANMSADLLLRNHSSPHGSANPPVVTGSNQSQSGSANTEMENQAEAMGFAKTQIKRVMERRVLSMGKGFDSIEELILALINEEPEHTSTGESLPEGVPSSSSGINRANEPSAGPSTSAANTINNTTNLPAESQRNSLFNFVQQGNNNVIDVAIPGLQQNLGFVIFQRNNADHGQSMAATPLFDIRQIGDGNRLTVRERPGERTNSSESADSNDNRPDRTF